MKDLDLEDVGLGCREMGENFLEETMEPGVRQQTMGPLCEGTGPPGWDTLKDNALSFNPQHVAWGFQ